MLSVRIPRLLSSKVIAAPITPAPMTIASADWGMKSHLLRLIRNRHRYTQQTLLFGGSGQVASCQLYKGAALYPSCALISAAHKRRRAAIAGNESAVSR